MPQSILKAIDICIKFKHKAVFENLSFGIEEGAKIALVGHNGAGKSTLLKAISGLQDLDTGEINYKQGLKVAYLPQDFTLDKNLTVQDFLLNNFSSDKDTPLKEVGKVAYNAYGELNPSSLEVLDLDIYLHKQELLIGYQKYFPFLEMEKKLEHLSGGQQRQTLIVKTLLDEPDLILLDEPTNHLDLASMEKLAEVLNNFKGSSVIISHDRYFLDQVSNIIWELDGGRIFKHKASYKQYLDDKIDRYEAAEARWQKLKQELRREHEWFISGVKARGTKDEGRIKRYKELKLQVETSRPKWQRPYLPLPKMPMLGNKILNLKNFSTKVPQTGQLVIKNLDIIFRPGLKLGILGPNGSGKTTLLQTIFNQYLKQVVYSKSPEKIASLPITTTDGDLIFGLNTKFNYIDQKRSQIELDKTIMANVSEGGNIEMHFGTSKTNVYAYLKKFAFDPKELKQLASNLSGGQKARLLLAKTLKHGGNFLILDEPTNDLDVDTMEALENSLLQFNGCCLIVSHDRFFLDRVCTNILTLEGEGEYTLANGGFSSYLQKYGPFSKYYSKYVKLLPQSHSIPVGPGVMHLDEPDDLLAISETVSVKGGTGNKALKVKKQTAKVQRQLNASLRKLEAEINKLQAKVENLELEMAEPSFYRQDSGDIIKFYEKLDLNKKALEKQEAKWLEIYKEME